MELLGDIVLNPLFDPAEMTKEKKVIFEEMSMVEDTPDDLVMELFTEAFWPDHPLGRPILGNRKTVGGGVLWAWQPAARTRASSPPETMSNPAPRRASNASTARLEFALTE